MVCIMIILPKIVNRFVKKVLLLANKPKNASQFAIKINFITHLRKNAKKIALGDNFILQRIILVSVVLKTIIIIALHSIARKNVSYISFTILLVTNAKIRHAYRDKLMMLISIAAKVYANSTVIIH